MSQIEWTRLANWTLPLDARASMLSRSDTMMQSGFLTFNFREYSQVEDIRRLLSCSAFRKDWHAAKRSRSLKQQANHLGEHGSRVVIHVFHICRSIDVRWLFQLQPQLLKHWSFELGVVGLSKLSSYTSSYLGACLQTDGRNALETYIPVIRSISLTSDLSLHGSCMELSRISRWSPTVRVLIVPVNPLQMWSTESLSGRKLIWFHQTSRYGGFLKWWYPTTMGFPTKNDQFGVFWGYQNLRKHPYDDEPSCTNTQSQFVFFPMWTSCPLPTLICQPHVVIYWLLLICLMCESNLTLFLFWTLSGHLLCSIYASRD